MPCSIRWGACVVSLPVMMSWVGGKVVAAVAVCTPLVRFPVESPSATWHCQNKQTKKTIIRSQTSVEYWLFSWHSPDEGWARWGCLFSAVLKEGVKEAGWPLALGASSEASHRLEQPGLHLWALGLEHLSLAERLRHPGPARNRKCRWEWLELWHADSMS